MQIDKARLAVLVADAKINGISDELLAMLDSLVCHICRRWNPCGLVTVDDVLSQSVLQFLIMMPKVDTSNPGLLSWLWKMIMVESAKVIHGEKKAFRLRRSLRRSMSPPDQ